MFVIGLFCFFYFALFLNLQLIVYGTIYVTVRTTQW